VGPGAPEGEHAWCVCVCVCAEESAPTRGEEPGSDRRLNVWMTIKCQMPRGDATWKQAGEDDIGSRGDPKCTLRAFAQNTSTGECKLARWSHEEIRAGSAIAVPCEARHLGVCRQRVGTVVALAVRTCRRARRQAVVLEVRVPGGRRSRGEEGLSPHAEETKAWRDPRERRRGKKREEVPWCREIVGGRACKGLSWTVQVCWAIGSPGRRRSGVGAHEARLRSATRST